MSIFMSILEQILLYLPIVLSIGLSYSILKLTDLTVDGSFILGAAVFAKLITLGFGLFASIAFAILAGAVAGLCVGFMQIKQRMNSLMASILLLFMLFSINLLIMGKPNINLLSTFTLFDMFDGVHSLTLLILINLTLCCAMYFILSTRFGLLLRALGENPQAMLRLGYPVDRYRCIGLMLSNALAALCGCLVAQKNGFTDIYMGTGVALIAIGMVVIGFEIVKKLKLPAVKHEIFAACALGALAYFTFLNFLIQLGINPVHIKLVLGLVLFSCLSNKKRGRT